MEQQAKERLTGGIILVALLVLLVPELLSDPSAPPPQSHAAPDQAPLRSYTVDLNDGSQHGSAPVAASTQSVEPAPVQGVSVASDEPPPAAVPAEQAASSAPVPVAGELPQPVPNPKATRGRRPQPAPATDSRAGSRPAGTSRPAVPEHTEAAPAGPAHSEPEHAASGHAVPRPAGTHRAPQGAWTVQLGVFGSRANAQRLASTLEHKGFAVKVAEIGPEGHRRYRVRVGSAHDHAGALRLLERLKSAGQHDATLVPP